MITSGEAGRVCSLASLSVVLLSLSLSEPELLSEPLWLLESSLDCSAASLLLLLLERTESNSDAQCFKGSANLAFTFVFIHEFNTLTNI